jgi:uroporphyrinogen decarboxylase
VAPIDPIVKTPEDVEKLEVPDPYTAYGWNELIATLKDVIAKKDFPYTFILAGCMTAVCPLITSVETFMRWTITEPDVAKKLLVKSRDYGIRSVERLVKELGADNFLLGDGYPTDSNVLISAKKFEEFTLPNLVEVHEKALKMGIPGFWAHWCSDHSKNIKAGLVDKVPLGKHGIMHFGPEVDTKTAVEHFGNRYIIMGNVDPVSMLLKTHEEVLQLAKQDIEKGKHSPKGYMLGVGCEMPPRTPPANVFALVKASREYGRY